MAGDGMLLTLRGRHPRSHDRRHRTTSAPDCEYRRRRRPALCRAHERATVLRPLLRRWSADGARCPVHSPAPRHGPFAGHVVPHGLRPLELRDELTELGDQFRSYQQRTDPDLALLADLHTRKAAAFTRWADVTGDRHLRREAQRAEQAAQTTRLQHQQRATRPTDDPDNDGPSAVARLLTGPAMWEHARSVLAHCATHPPLSGPEARLVVVMLTLRTAHTRV